MGRKYQEKFHTTQAQLMWREHEARQGYPRDDMMPVWQLEQHVSTGSSNNDENKTWTVVGDGVLAV